MWFGSGAKARPHERLLAVNPKERIACPILKVEQHQNLRGRTKTQWPCGSGWSAKHDAYRGDMNPSGDRLAEAFLVPGGTVAVDPPANVSLHAPALWHAPESLLGVGALHHLHFEAGLKHRHVGGQLRTAEPAVTADAPQPVGGVQHLVEARHGAGGLRQFRGKHLHPQYVAQGVREQEALAALGLPPAAVAGLHWQTGGANLCMEKLADGVVGPRSEETVSGALGPELQNQFSPLASALTHVEECVQDETEPGARLARRLGLGDERLELAPVRVGKFGAVRGDSHRRARRYHGKAANSRHGWGKCKCVVLHGLWNNSVQSDLSTSIRLGFVGALTAKPKAPLIE